MKGHQRILELHSLLSKLLDSLCFELSVNHVDDNCFSLLQILLWKKQGQISHEECAQLYKSWLQSKSVFDLFTCKQTETYPKSQLIANQLAHSSYMNVGQITKALENINELYNKLYLEKRPNNSHLIEKVQRIFSYLDSAGFIHIRSSSLFFLAVSLSLAQNYSIPINYDSFRIHFEDIKKQMCEIDGLVSLRGYKNYFLGQPTPKKTQALQKILPILFQFVKKLNSNNQGLPNIINEAFNKWKHFPRFSSHDSKKNLQIYKRVFQENQKAFFEDGANLQYFNSKYGEQFVRCFDIDASLLRQFNTIIKQLLNKYLDVFSKMQSLQKTPLASHKKKQKSQLPHTKLTAKYSGREKTPTRSFKKAEVFKANKTPTKKVHHPNHDWHISRRQFGSAQKSKSKSYNARQTTPTKSYRPMTSNLYQSQANTNQKSAVKNGLQKDSFYNKMFFFRNKRVESYEIVMKRLKGK